MLNKNLSLVNDYAINESDNDSLNFEIYSQTMSETILSTKTPFTFGVYGNSGSGKTSLLNLLSKKIESLNLKVFNIYYDAWKLETDQHTLIVLLDLIEASIINERYKHHEDTITSLLDYINYIKKASYSLESQNNDSDSFHTSIEIFQLFKALENLLEEQQLQLIIYVDNLEKCKPDNIIKILNSINMIFDLRGFSFIISANKEALEAKIANNIHDPIDYLDKLIQLPFKIPNMNNNIDSFLDKLNNQLSLDDDIINVLNSLNKYNNLTPRILKKIINKIHFSIDIYKKINTNTTLTTDQIKALLSVSCTLEELFQSEFEEIIKNDTLIFTLINAIQNEDKINEDILHDFNIPTTTKLSIINKLNSNCFVLKHIFSTEQGKFWLENRNYRISVQNFIKTHYQDTDHKTTTIMPYAVEQEDGIINPKQFVPIPDQDFEMAKYVVTNKWFKEFINAGGYSNPKYWDEISAHVWLLKNKITTLEEKYSQMVSKEGEFFKKKYKEELLVTNFNDDLQPVVYITYYEALAFCNYLTHLDPNYTYSIPTKEEWEYVAKGGSQNRAYPWGDHWNKHYCNNAQIQLNCTSKIGTFPQGDSIYGISDMSGNVWVWTSSLEQRNNLNYLKGGSWNFSDPSYFKTTDNGQITFYNNASFKIKVHKINI